jgi:hypothetical protein
MRSLIILFSIVVILFSGCQQESGNKNDTASMLLGAWKLTSATRNGNVTETLDNLKLEFINDTLLYSNLSSSREEQTYKLENLTISTEGARINPAYKIVSITDSTLQLQMILNDYQFEFSFVQEL